MEKTFDQIILDKQKEVESLIECEKRDPKNSFETLLKKKQKNQHLFRDSLKVAGLSVIAEIKRKPPLGEKPKKNHEFLKQAHIFSKSGPAAISVVTDFKYLGGTIQDLKALAHEFDSLHPCPILRRDFIIHPYQVAETKKNGASALLLIASILKERLKEFLEHTSQMGLEAVVEVSNEAELKMALDFGAQIIGVNTYKAKTSDLDLDMSKTLAAHIPKNIVKIVISEITSIDQASQLHLMGYDGVLVGDLLLKSSDPRGLISEIGNL